MVYYRDYVMNSQDEHHYYSLENGEVRTPYVDIADGKPRTSLTDLYVYSQATSCAEIVLRTVDMYVSDVFNESKIQTLTDQNIFTKYFINE